jgi:integrase
LPARPLTDAEVRALRATPGERLILYDAKARGLCLRISPRTKAWSFVYRPKGAMRQRRLTIGNYPAWSLAQASDKAFALRRLVQDGRDPVVENKARRDMLTVRGMVERFVHHAQNRLRSWRTYQDLLRRDVIPVVGDRRADDVARTDVADLLDRIAERAPVVANRVQNTLSSVYNWALSEGLVNQNPVRGLRKRHAEIAKDRVLSDTKIRQFWAATADATPVWRDILRLILLTGQRSGECAGLCAEELDLDHQVWRLPAVRVKNKRAHLVPLVGEALAIVQRLQQERGGTGPLLLTTRAHTPNSQDVAVAFRRICDKLFQERATPHDLRRTAATLMGRLEIDRLTIAHVLNHATTTRNTVTGSVYDQHDYFAQKRRALTALEKSRTSSVNAALSKSSPSARVDGVRVEPKAPRCFTDEQYRALVRDFGIKDGRAEAALNDTLSEMVVNWHFVRALDDALATPSAHRKELHDLVLSARGLSSRLRAKPLLTNLIPSIRQIEGIEEIVLRAIDGMADNAEALIDDPDKLLTFRKRLLPFDVVTNPRKSIERRVIWEPMLELWRSLKKPLRFGRSGPIVRVLNTCHQALGIRPPSVETLKNVVTEFRRTAERKATASELQPATIEWVLGPHGFEQRRGG